MHAAHLDLAQRWLVRVRRGWLAIEVVLLLVAEAGTDLHVHPPILVALLCALALADLLEYAYVRRAGTSRGLVAVHAAVDLLALTGVLAETGGAHNPLISAYLLYVVLVAVVFPARDAILAAVVSMALQASVVLLVPADDLSRVHLVGHVAAFDLAAIAITWVVSTLSSAVRTAERERASVERLAALGTMAAGVAHELGTPLGTLQLLADEAVRDEGDSARWGEIRRELQRCASLLERLRGRDQPADPDCTPELATWVAEWRRSTPWVTVEVTEGAAVETRVAGAPESWRAALWTTLDNARQAGAHTVRVEATVAVGEVVVRVTDDGSGLAGEEYGVEPFRSGWGSTGLGLFVARAFAASVGGDVSVASGASGGATATLRMRRTS